MTTGSITKAYARFVSIYDLVFGYSLAKGRRAAIERMNLQPGDRVLEVGVGTGWSLPYYPRDVKVTGIDISSEMLSKADKRVKRRKLNHVENLCIMNAQAMNFADNSFDAVVAMYIMAVVPDPNLVLREMTRVGRTGGRIVIANYFRNGNKSTRITEWMVKPLSKMFHFKFDLDLGAFVEQGNLDIVESFHANMFRHTTVLHCRNR